MPLIINKLVEALAKVAAAVEVPEFAVPSMVVTAFVQVYVIVPVPAPLPKFKVPTIDATYVRRGALTLAEILYFDRLAWPMTGNLLE